MAKRMRLRLETPDGSTFKLKMPDDDAPSVEVPNAECRQCKRPLRVYGMGKRIHAFDVYVADARCCYCGVDAGRLFLKVPTLFGLEEDSAVARMATKIY